MICKTNEIRNYVAFNLGTYTELVDVIGASVVVDDEGVLGVTVVVVPRRGVVVVVTSLRGSVAVPVWAVVKEEFGGKSEGYEEGLNRIQLLSNSTNIINDFKNNNLDEANVSRLLQLLNSGMYEKCLLVLVGLCAPL